MEREPLAHRLRPKTVDEFVGQEHLTGPDKPLRVAMKEKHLFSFIFWGPPGVGKTTLAMLYAEAVGAQFFSISAVAAGKDDMRRVLEVKSKRPKLLFIDEIHRFNKAQQDFLLPYVERGQITLVGATTENPSFEVIAPLLSRCRVFALNELSADELATIINRTNMAVDDRAREWLISFANGDARQLLGVLEAADALYGNITVETLERALSSSYRRYDKRGEEHYNVISAFIKSMRAGEPNAALYYLARMVDAGEDPKFIARRMVIFASEDIGMAQPTALVVANDVFRAVEIIGYPECAINLAHGVVYLATAAKDRSAYNGLQTAMADVKKYGNLPVPLKLRNAPTKLMKELGYGKDYERYDREDLLPAKLKNKIYWKPGKKES